MARILNPQNAHDPHLSDQKSLFTLIKTFYYYLRLKNYHGHEIEMVRIPTSSKKIEKQWAGSLAKSPMEDLSFHSNSQTLQVVRVTMVNVFTIPLYL